MFYGRRSKEKVKKVKTLKIDSYVENVQRKLTVFSESEEKLILKDTANGKFLAVTKRSDTIIMEGDLMESIVGIREKYEIEKTVR